MVAIEIFFPPIPSEVILLFGGFMNTTTKLSIVGMIIASTLGSLIWNTVLIIIGILVGENLVSLINVFDTYSQIAVILILVVFAIAVLLFYKNSKSEKQKN